MIFMEKESSREASAQYTVPGPLLPEVQAAVKLLL